jgi:tRNA pseudouridine32 synthase/23S rRNA pseudouridine746 synthase
LALNKKSAASASKLFENRLVKKTYLALVNGHLKDDEYVDIIELNLAASDFLPRYFVDQPIDDDPDHEFRMAIMNSGKPAQTKIIAKKRGYYHYKEEKTGLNKSIPVTLVNLSPVSGRRHQLRVHLKYIGHPIVGDFNYEEVYTDTFRMMLHAHEIILPLPGQEELKAVAVDPFDDLVTPLD